MYECWSIWNHIYMNAFDFEMHNVLKRLQDAHKVHNIK